MDNREIETNMIGQFAHFLARSNEVLMVFRDNEGQVVVGGAVANPVSLINMLGQAMIRFSTQPNANDEGGAPAAPEVPVKKRKKKAPEFSKPDLEDVHV